MTGSDGVTQVIDTSGALVSVELKTPEMTLNIGPQHPSTHGVLRLVAQVDGERIVAVEPMIGYMHRGYEKIVEARTYTQVNALVDRIDWTSGLANEVPFVVAIERLMGLEVPERAQFIRVMLTEMFRISAHLLFLCSYPLELGASTPLMYALREREKVLDMIEALTGSRPLPAAGPASATSPLIYPAASSTEPERQCVVCSPSATTWSTSSWATRSSCSAPGGSG
jgi:NADH:ubiquinone oxidoreductase subunit D